MRQPKPKVAAVVVPKIQRFTIDAVCKFAKKHKELNLLQMIFMFPNFGQGFKVFYKIRPQDYHIVDNISMKNNRHGKLFGIFYKNGQMEKKIKEIRNTLKPGRWLFEPSPGICHTDNAIQYDILKTEQLIEEKKKMMMERNKMFGIIGYYKNLELEKKKKIAEQLAKKKK